MFQSLFKRAEVAIEQSIGQIVARVVMAVPFLVAAGFGTAAISLRLNRDYGAEAANLLMAGLFVGLGALVALVMAMRRPTLGATAPEPPVGASAADGEPHAQHESGMSDADRELMMAALTSAAPLAVPYLSRLLLRNLPLVAAIAASIFVMTRPSPDTGVNVAPAE